MDEYLLSVKIIFILNNAAVNPQVVSQKFTAKLLLADPCLQ